MENKQLIKALRDLAEKINDGAVAAIDSSSEGGDIEKQIAHMIELYPEIWGKGGSMRPWLERKSAEIGIDADQGLPSDFGPINNPNE